MPGREPLSESSTGSDRRRAALIASAVTLPVIVIVALFLGHNSGSDPDATSSDAPLPALSVAAPAHTDDKTVATCAAVISALPLELDRQALRRTVSKPASPSIVAWGNPAIVLRCGVARPASLKPGSTTVYVTGGVGTGPFYDVVAQGSANVWTTVDRAVYIEISVPAKYNSGPLPAISRAIAKALPSVCTAGQPVTGTTDQSKLCAERS